MCISSNIAQHYTHQYLPFGHFLLSHLLYLLIKVAGRNIIFFLLLFSVLCVYVFVCVQVYMHAHAYPCLYEHVEARGKLHISFLGVTVHLEVGSLIDLGLPNLSRLADQ